MFKKNNYSYIALVVLAVISGILIVKYLSVSYKGVEVKQSKSGPEETHTIELTNGTTYSQTFRSVDNGLHKVNVQFSVEENLQQTEVNKRLIFRIKERNEDEWSRERITDIRAMKESGNISFVFPEIDNSKKKEYIFQLTTDNIEEESKQASVTASLIKNGSYENGSFSINNENMEELDLVFNIHHKESLFDFIPSIQKDLNGNISTQRTFFIFYGIFCLFLVFIFLYVLVL